MNNLSIEIAELKELISLKGLNFNPTLEEETISLFEKEHHITLPEDYRSFIKYIGNGGDGPPGNSGLIKLGGELPGFSAIEKEIWFKHSFINKEFIFTDYWFWDDEQDTESKEFAEKLASSQSGSIMLGTEGCGEYWILIVTGQCRGEVWNLSNDGIQPCVPRLHFLDWYKAWLNHTPKSKTLFWLEK